MKEYVLELRDIRDSKEFIEQKVPKFMIVFIYLFLVITFSVLIWMWFCEIDIVVKATGIVRPDKNISTVINVNPGSIKNIYYKEGQEVEEGEILYTVDTAKLDLQKEVIIKSTEKIQKDLENLKTFELSIKQDKNLFKEDEIEFYNRYISYKLKKKQLELDCAQTKKRYLQEKSLGLGFTTEATLNELEAKWDYAKLTLDQNKSEMIYNLKSKTLEDEAEILKLKSQLKEIDKNIELSSVKSPINGTVQLIANYNIGDYINSSIQVLKIIPQGTKYKMEIIVNNQDISQIKLGQDVNFRFLAFPYKEYGTIKGQIKSISNDIISEDPNNNMTYKVEADIPNIKLYSKKGTAGKVKVGMLSNVRIVSRRKKILYIVLEKLNFISDL